MRDARPHIGLTLIILGIVLIVLSVGGLGALIGVGMVMVGGVMRWF